MKSLLKAVFLFIVLALLFFFFAGAKMLDRQMNVCLHIDDDHYNIRPEILTFHDSLIVADWHSDLLLWDRSVLKRGTSGHTDLPRLIEGNFTLQVFDAVIKTPRGQNYQKNSGDTDNITLLSMANRWPIKTWSSLYERAIYQSDKLHKAAALSKKQLRIIKSSIDLTNLINSRKENSMIVGGLLSIEGLHALEGDIDNLDKLYSVGYRMMGPVHFFDNAVGGSSAGVDQGGLTEFGKEVIRKMNEKGIIIDLAHASPALITDILNLTTQPVVVSHTGVRGTSPSPRNLSDDQLKAIAANGGMIGIGFWDGAVGAPDVDNIVKAMKYTADLIGVDHVCLGSDWDGGTTTYFDAAHVAILTQELIDSGFSRDDVRKIMGGNQINFLLENLPKR